jgi:hypothetical protein
MPLRCEKSKKKRVIRDPRDSDAALLALRCMLRRKYFSTVLESNSNSNQYRAEVMAGLVPAILVFSAAKQVVDGRDMRGHDVAEGVQCTGPGCLGAFKVAPRSIGKGFVNLTVVHANAHHASLRMAEVLYAAIYAVGIGVLLAAALFVAAPWQADQ